MLGATIPFQVDAAAASILRRAWVSDGEGGAGSGTGVPSADAPPDRESPQRRAERLRLGLLRVIAERELPLDLERISNRRGEARRRTCAQRLTGGR